MNPSDDKESWLVTEELFSDGGEVWFHQILTPLSFSESVSLICSLRCVSTLWRSLISRLVHINAFLPPRSASWHKCLIDLFPVCHSLRTDERILTCWTQPEAFMGIRHLFLIPATLEPYSDSDSYGETEEYIDQFEGLTSLYYPSRWGHLPDLETLTNLTSLDINAGAFTRETDLGKLTNLRELRIVALSVKGSEELRKLTNLTYLSSDRIGYFSNYTGRGAYAMAQEEMDDEDYQAESLALSHIQKNCRSAFMEGEWRDGLFIRGTLNLEYYNTRGQACFYQGVGANGMREGIGTETNTHTQEEYRGEWRQNQRHGLGSVYTWRYIYYRKDALILCYEGKWRDGVLIDSNKGAQD